MSRSEDPLRRAAGLFAGFLAATAFFTRLPVEPRAVSEWRLADSAWAFPLVGAGIGGAAAFAFLLAQLIGSAIALAALGPVRGAMALCLTGAIVFAMAELARRQIGGYTGDVLGAFQQVGEIVMLLAALAR